MWVTSRGCLERAKSALFAAQAALASAEAEEEAAPP